MFFLCVCFTFNVTCLDSSLRVIIIIIITFAKKVVAPSDSSKFRLNLLIVVIVVGTCLTKQKKIVAFVFILILTPFFFVFYPCVYVTFFILRSNFSNLHTLFDYLRLLTTIVHSYHSLVFYAKYIRNNFILFDGNVGKLRTWLFYLFLILMRNVKYTYLRMYEFPYRVNLHESSSS